MSADVARIPQLDGLRGTAMIMVLIWHFTGSLVDPTQGGWAAAVQDITVFGRSGVDLFFVLSGFLIIGILADHKDSPNLLTVFYLRRIARILPPYFLLTTIYWIGVLFLGPSRMFNVDIPWWSQMTFTQNWIMGIRDYWGGAAHSITWSVAIEEQFYMFFPAVVIFTPRKYLALILLGVAFCSASARAAIHLALPDNAYAPYVITPFRLDGLCVGGLVALAYRNPKVWHRLARIAPNILLVLGALIPFFLFVIHFNLRSNMYLWGHVYLTILYSVLLIYLIDRQTIFSSLVLREAGAISYSAYLFHPLFLGLAFYPSTEQLQSFGDLAKVLGALVLTVLFCWWVRSWVEAPAINWGHRFRYLSRNDTGAVRAPSR